MIRDIVEGAYYRHFKGNWYKLIVMAKDTETKEDISVYQALYGDYKVYTRATKQFISKVPDGKENPTGQPYRFMSSDELGFSTEEIEKELGLGISEDVEYGKITVWGRVDNKEKCVSGKQEFNDIYEAIRFLEKNGHSDKSILDYEFRRSLFQVIPISIFTLLKSRDIKL